MKTFKKSLSLFYEFFRDSLRNRIYNRFYEFKNRKRIEKLKNIHQGERCFIIGTGPSLNRTNFELIKNEILFGVNTLYRGFKKFGIKCQYYACSDKKVWQKHAKGMLMAGHLLFLSGGAAKHYLENKNFFQKFKKKEPLTIKQLGFMWEKNEFARNLSKGTYNGDTVIIDVCLQAAFYMGFKKVYLLGCDCDYTGFHRFDGSQSENLEGGGVKGSWSKVFKSYKICKDVFEKNNKEIINATVGGKLKIFKRQKLEEII